MRIALDCPKCGREIGVTLRQTHQHFEVVSIECPAQCNLSLQEEFDLEVEALAIAETDVEEESNSWYHHV